MLGFHAIDASLATQEHSHLARKIRKPCSADEVIRRGEAHLSPVRRVENGHVFEMIVAVADEIVEQSETCERLDSLDGSAEPAVDECGNVARGSAFQFGILRAGQNAEGLREVFLMASEHVSVVGISGRAVVAFAAHNRAVQVEQSDVCRGNTAAQGGFGAQIFKVKDIAIG